MNNVRFIEVEKGDFNKYAGCLQAAHCMIYTKLPPGAKCIENCNARGIVLMQMRFDGQLGFGGGIIEPGEEVVDGLTRELVEEINFPTKHEIRESDRVVTHYDNKHSILLHFFCYQVKDAKDIMEIERNTLSSVDYGKETLGIVRVPLYSMPPDNQRGFPLFLRNSFVGNSYAQLLTGLKHVSLMTEDEIITAEKAGQVIEM